MHCYETMEEFLEDEEPIVQIPYPEEDEDFIWDEDFQWIYELNPLNPEYWA